MGFRSWIRSLFIRRSGEGIQSSAATDRSSAADQRDAEARNLAAYRRIVTDAKAGRCGSADYFAVNDAARRDRAAKTDTNPDLAPGDIAVACEGCDQAVALAAGDYDSARRSGAAIFCPDCAHRAVASRVSESSTSYDSDPLIIVDEPVYPVVVDLSPPVVVIDDVPPVLIIDDSALRPDPVVTGLVDVGNDGIGSFGGAGADGTWP